MAVGGYCIISTSERYGTLLIILSIMQFSLFKIKVFYTVKLRSGHRAYFLQHFHQEIDGCMCNKCVELVLFYVSLLRTSTSERYGALSLMAGDMIFFPLIHSP